ncbi:TIL domain-containing protein [Caerostris extrusa]|uniref:TIL domain-containing protein n=1 Tax=Caerostris extrusa TaxID=172846 RepID=A0AAV4XFC4_CAEEX|nr:TIL domain-containing protein [Caerostris extrusa]
MALLKTAWYLLVSFFGLFRNPENSPIDQFGSAPCSLHAKGIGSSVSCSSNSGDGVKCMVICNNKFEGVYACRSGNWSPKLPSCAKPSTDIANEARCSKDEDYSLCAGHCQVTCFNYRDEGRSCTPGVCVEGCICKTGLVRSPEGKCVSLSECIELSYPGSECLGLSVKNGGVSCSNDGFETLCEVFCNGRHGKFRCTPDEGWTPQLPPCARPI